MPPPWATNPAPKTESARSAAKSFFCALCQKGYSRINEFEAHEGSYDHQHKKRLKDMKLMSRDPHAADRARRAEEKADGAIRIQPISLGGSAGGSSKGGSGFKKGGFRNAFSEVVAAPAGVKEEVARGKENLDHRAGGRDEVVMQDVTEKPGQGRKSEEKAGEGEGEDEWNRWGDYDPRRPTGCSDRCPGRRR